jgi:heme-degrading monooxygenase HmoA
VFCAIYRFVAKPEKERQLEESWRTLTDLIYVHSGSLGSRLHRAAGGPSEYIAYAQWPSREKWKASNLPAEADPVRAALRDACERIETLYELETLDDRLRAQPFGSAG